MQSGTFLPRPARTPSIFPGSRGYGSSCWVPGFFLFIEDVRQLDAELLVWAGLSGVIHGLYILSLSRAYHTQDISYVYPIARSAPVFVPVFAFFLLGEQISFITALAIVIILVAIYILHFDGHLIRGFKNLFDAIIHRDLRWMFYTLAMVVAYSLVDKKGMDYFFSIVSRADIYERG